jgi:benzoyl-CoA reductase/2-hydroxyglutaryl-CoA dehydratase subunit BcrC/BadD/HgdB
MDCPRIGGEIAENYLVARYRELLAALECETGRIVSEGEIRKAVEVLNESRRLIGRIGALRRMPGSLLTGADFSEIARCAVQSDKSRFNTEAARFLAAHESSGQGSRHFPKVLLCGCAAPGEEVHDLIEACGIRIVADDLCTGERHFDGLVEPSLDPLRGIARRYLQRGACARMAGASSRIGRLMELAHEARVDGIIFLALKFCDLVQSDLPRLREAAQGLGIPLLHMERDNLIGTDGQMRTRIQAFAEIMEKRR